MRISDWSSDVCSSDLVLRLGIAARILIDDPPVAPDFVAPAGAAIGAGANGDRCVVLDRSQPRSGQRRGEQVVGARGAGSLQQSGERGECDGPKGCQTGKSGDQFDQGKARFLANGKSA